MKGILWVAITLIASSCVNSGDEEARHSFQERKLNFSDLRFGYDTTNRWIREPRNILMLHETFKKVGYDNLMSKSDWSDEWVWYLNIRKTPGNLIDSLEMTYSDLKGAPEYYKKFWKRREKEENKEVVYQIIREIKQVKNGKGGTEVDPRAVNDTLEQLVSFEYPKRDLTDAEANDFLAYLIKIGLHQSAYNVVSDQNSRFTDISWNRPKEEVIRELSESDIYQRPWIEDDTK